MGPEGSRERRMERVMVLRQPVATAVGSLSFRSVPSQAGSPDGFPFSLAGCTCSDVVSMEMLLPCS